jgi:hypothetical protein
MATPQAATGQPLPPFWARFSIAAGNAIQAAGLLAGAGLLAMAAHVGASPGVRLALAILGWLAIYICCHASAHWAVGRLVGIHFRGYGLRGTDHPENYPPGVRQFMSIFPMFTAMTEKASMRQARPIAKALMFAAGETSTTICSLLAAGYAWRTGIPGGVVLWWFTVVLVTFSTVVTALVPKGDYAKALRALRTPTSGPSPSGATH